MGWDGVVVGGAREGMPRQRRPDVPTPRRSFLLASLPDASCRLLRRLPLMRTRGVARSCGPRARAATPKGWFACSFLRPRSRQRSARPQRNFLAFSFSSLFLLFFFFCLSRREQMISRPFVPDATAPGQGGSPDDRVIMVGCSPVAQETMAESVFLVVVGLGGGCDGHASGPLPSVDRGSRRQWLGCSCCPRGSCCLGRGIRVFRSDRLASSRARLCCRRLSRRPGAQSDPIRSDPVGSRRGVPDSRWLHAAPVAVGRLSVAPRPSSKSDWWSSPPPPPARAPERSPPGGMHRCCIPWPSARAIAGGSRIAGTRAGPSFEHGERNADPGRGAPAVPPCPTRPPRPPPWGCTPRMMRGVCCRV